MPHRCADDRIPPLVRIPLKFEPSQAAKFRDVEKFGDQRFECIRYLRSGQTKRCIAEVFRIGGELATGKDYEVLGLVAEIK